MSKTKTLAIALAVTLGSSACATRAVYVCPALPEPARPHVPLLADDSLECLSDTAAERLAGRERRLVEYSEDLETIITAHNRNCARVMLDE